MNKSIFLLLTLALTACPPPIDSEPSSSSTDSTPGSESGSSETAPTESLPDDAMPLAGGWVDNWEGTHLIDNDEWAMGESVFHLSVVDASEGWAVAQNSEDNDWSPGLWSRFDWVEASHNGWWFCQTSFDSPTEDDAIDTPPADPTDPATSGCGGFGWSRLYVPLPIRGSYVDGWEGSHDIREWTWTMGDSVFHVVDYNVDERWIIAQNDEDNDWNPELWSRFDWAEHDEAIWFCQTAFDAATEQAARDTPPADDTDPESSGCGGFSWSSLTRED